MAKPRGAGISGVAVAMVGAGALAVYAAIKGTSPLEELRGIITGKRPEKLSTQPRGSPISGGTSDFSGGSFGTTGSGSRAATANLRPHVAAESRFIADTWKIETQGFAFRNIAGTNTLSDHALGLAVDAMLPAGAKRVPMGNEIAGYYKSNAQAKRVKYVIWQHEIWFSDGRGSRPYSKNDHFNHVHISFYPLGNPRAR